jgi:hypothetical protein
VSAGVAIAGATASSDTVRAASLLAALRWRAWSTRICRISRAARQ